MRKQKKYHFIYKTTNLLNGRYYIGMHSTDNLDDGYLGTGRRIRYSLNKYGNENHQREILEFCENREELSDRESEIVSLDEIAKQECMNLQVGGGRVYTPTSTEESRRRMRLAQQNRSPETRKKLSDSLRGRTLSESHKKKLSENHWDISRGNHPMAKACIDIETNIKYSTIREMSISLSVPRTTMMRWIRDSRNERFEYL